MGKINILSALWICLRECVCFSKMEQNEESIYLIMNSTQTNKFVIRLDGLNYSPSGRCSIEKCEIGHPPLFQADI